MPPGTLTYLVLMESCLAVYVLTLPLRQDSTYIATHK